MITNAASDVADPQKTIPRAIYITLFLVMSLYCGLAFVVLNFIPGSELYGNPDTAVATAAKRLLGSGGQAVMYLTAVIAFISGISATFFSIFRITRSLAHQHILPAFYMHTFWRHGTFGNLLTTVLIMLATVFFDFTSIVNLSSAAFLVSYLGVFAAAMVGGLIGFLVYNFHPAKVFMGDTGSLFLGGAVAALAFAYDMPLVLIPVGFVYICETLSDILQVIYFKATHGKRLFKMAPLHHHFELCGWSEVKLVAVFTSVSALCCLAALFGVLNRFHF